MDMQNTSDFMREHYRDYQPTVVRDCGRDYRAEIRAEGELADKMRKEPPGRFCGWGGLNPHIAVVSAGPAVCRTCERNDVCAETWKAASL